MVPAFVTRAIGMTLLVSLANYWLWRRLVRDTTRSRRARSVSAVVLAVLALITPLAAIRPPPLTMRPLFLVIYCWTGALLLLLTATLAAEVVRLGVRAVEKARATKLDEDKRLTLHRILGGAIALGAGTAATAGAIEALDVGASRIDVGLARLPASLDGFRIAQLSDVHIGPAIGKAYVEKLVAMTNALAPDLIVITGDLVDGTVARLRDQVAPIAELRAKHGVFFSTGNHEYYTEPLRWIEALKELGVRSLVNERVSIDDPRGSFDLAGVPDFKAGEKVPEHAHDLPKALAGRDPSRVCVLMAHQPRSAREAAKLGVDLQLSGHTHGGQIFPIGLVLLLQQPFTSGLHKLGETLVYVTHGCGYWGPPMRVGAPPEIAEITLRRA